MREIVFPGVSREVMFHSFDEDKRWTLGGLWNFFYSFFSFLFFAEFGKSPAGCDVIFIPLPAETPESWPERPIFISSKDVHYALITSPRGWTFKTDTWIPKNSSILQELKILLYYPQKPNFGGLLLYNMSHFLKVYFSAVWRRDVAGIVMIPVAAILQTQHPPDILTPELGVGEYQSNIPPVVITSSFKLTQLSRCES